MKILKFMPPASNICNSVCMNSGSALPSRSAHYLLNSSCMRSRHRFMFFMHSCLLTWSISRIDFSRSFASAFSFKLRMGKFPFSD